ncbi:Type II secretion system protein E [hydrothermal vent metagenome]|uniref:Type II secretion system protein E n=1 Tax=hydrothermal vent metagenome TaxID=652676 RepID=A0A3B0XLY7_9ZZZZ
MSSNTNNTIADIGAALRAKKKRLGEELIQQGLITEDQVSIALKEQKKTAKPLGEALVSLGFVTEAVLRDALSEMLGKDSIDLSNVVPDTEALERIPKDLSIRFNVIPVSFNAEENTLSVAMTDIYNLLVLDRLRAVVGNRVEIIPLLSGESEISDAIDQFYGYELSVDGILHEIETGEVDYDSLDVEGDAYSQPLVRLVDAILADAVKHGASDIHFEPEEGFLRLRYRIDGVLRQVRSLHKDYWSAIVVRLKVISNMNIAETRAPQDGRINLNIRGHQIDFRVSSQPTTHGENVVLRVLDRAKGIVPIDDLGLHDDALAELKLMMARPEGIILVTGPTGSGKTTTLYSMLGYVRSIEVNIMTLEDPVEYPMDMVRQTSINEVLRMDFANGIRSLMRQDPDIILVGEIRDADTAEMALRAAMTGHQVYSTLHTNSAIGSIPRLVDIGVKAEIMSGNIIGIMGQRLVRKLCKHCKTSHEANDVEKTLLGLNLNESQTIYDANGCDKCSDIGYKGRLAILEVLRIDDELDEMIAEQLTMGKFKSYLKQKGFKTLADDAARRVIDGDTSLDEVSRVIDLTDRL